MRRSNRLSVAAFGLALFATATVGAADWPMYGRNNEHTFTNADSTINPTNVVSLEPAWTFVPTYSPPQTGFDADQPDAFTASPAVVDGVVYVGSWDGFFYAINASTGAEIWRFQVDCQTSAGLLPVPNHCGPETGDRMTTDGGIITSSAAVVDGNFSCPLKGSPSARVVFFAGGKTMYSLDAATGAPCWKKVICGNPDAPSCESDSADPTRIFSSPAVLNGKVFVGATIDGIASGYRGGFVALDANTGAQVWRFEVDVDGLGQPINRGCGGVWSSAAIADEPGTGSDLVFFNTADCDFDAPPPYHEAIIALSTETGAVAWAYRPRAADTCDFDFGASPNVIDLGSEKYLGNGGKDGTYYMLKRLTTNPAGELAWKNRVVYGGFSGGFIGSTAFDGQRIFGGTAFGELGKLPVPFCVTVPPLIATGGPPPLGPPVVLDTVIQEPSMHAFDAATGSVFLPSGWQQVGNHTFAASSVADGVVFVGTLAPGTLRAYHADTGALLKVFAIEGAINSGAAIVNDVVFVGSGNSHDGAGSGVHAFKLP